MIIKIATKIREGRKAQIFMLDKEHDGTMLGAILCSDGWSSIEWTSTGEYRDAVGNPDFDLVSEWRDKKSKK